uniref:Uncharacterized protein n=1 Tax=Avena sativa TaxID=4498 RepID=A0ACD6A6S9_AVESA
MTGVGPQLQHKEPIDGPDPPAPRAALAAAGTKDSRASDRHAGLSAAAVAATVTSVRRMLRRRTATEAAAAEEVVETTQIMTTEVVMLDFFVGTVPRIASEDDIRHLFEEHGDVLEVALIRNRKTGGQEECYFVKYATSEEAERAIRAFHNQHTIPGATGPLQVRYVNSKKKLLETIERRLFVASLNKQATTKEIEEVLSYFIEVFLVERILCCGELLIYLCLHYERLHEAEPSLSSKEPALAAMNSLSGTYIMKGCEQPLVVRFADLKRPRPEESRPTANLAEPRGRHMPPNTWHPSSASSVTPQQFNNFGSDNPMGLMGGTVTSAADNGAFRPQMFHWNGQTAVPTPSHMGINLSSLQGYLGGQQMTPLQKPSGPPHNFPVQLQNQQGQHYLGPGSFGQNAPSMQLPGQLPVSQPLTQQNASAGTLQAPSTVQSNPMQPVPGQQQLPSNVTQQMLQ